MDEGDFINACKNGDINRIKTMIKNDVDGNMYMDGCGSLLIYAYETGLDIITFLLENYVNLEIKNDFGSNIFNSACWRNDLHIIKLLLQNNVNIGEKNNLGRTGFANLFPSFQEYDDLKECANFLKTYIDYDDVKLAIIKIKNVFDNEWLVEYFSTIINDSMKYLLNFNTKSKFRFEINHPEIEFDLLFNYAVDLDLKNSFRLFYNINKLTTEQLDYIYENNPTMLQNKSLKMLINNSRLSLLSILKQ